MKHILTVIAVAITLHASSFAADWTVVSTSSTALTAEERTPFESDSFWLNIKLRNDSKVIQYLEGLSLNWFKIEAFVRRQESGTWERQNTMVDQKLKWFAIKPGEEVKIKKGMSGADVGLPIMLTFRRALAPNSTGSPIMLDQIIVPAPPKNP